MPGESLDAPEDLSKEDARQGLSATRPRLGDEIATTSDQTLAALESSCLRVGTGEHRMSMTDLARCYVAMVLESPSAPRFLRT